MVDIRAKLSSGLEQITGTLIGTKVTMDTTKVMEDSSTGNALNQTGETVGDKKAGHVKVVDNVRTESLTESDIADGKITFTTTMKEIEIYNESTSNDLTYTINTIAITLGPGDSDTGKYADFTEVTITGTSPDFLAVGLG